MKFSGVPEWPDERSTASGKHAMLPGYEGEGGEATSVGQPQEQQGP